VITAANGTDAIALFEQQAGQVRLVLLDTDMPVLDGRATIPYLRNQEPAVPIVLMSGEVELVSSAGTAAKLVKPFQLEDLLRTIAAQLFDR
jgi:CheY-like chemotaxis protein